MEQKIIGTKELVRGYYKPEKLLPYCQACKNYANNYACPPNRLDMKKYLLDYLYADVFLELVDIQAVTEKEEALALYGRAKDKFVAELVEKEKLKPASKAIVPGGCKLCPSCLRVDQKPCRYPEQMRFNITAFSLDVTSLAEDLFAKQLEWFGPENPPYLILLGAILTNDPGEEESNG